VVLFNCTLLDACVLIVIGALQNDDDDDDDGGGGGGGGGGGTGVRLNAPGQLPPPVRCPIY